MEKNSFSLFETLLSIVLLSVVIVGFSRYSYYDNFDKEFQTLNSVENSFNTNTYNTNFQTKTKTIKIYINDMEEKNLSVDQITYKTDEIMLVKYEIK